MSHILVLVSSSAAHPLGQGDLDGVADFLHARGIESMGDVVWLGEDKAAKIAVSQALDYDAMVGLRAVLAAAKIDALCVAADQPALKLALFDMDSTIVDAETLDEMAEMAGVGAEVKAITHQAMVEGADFDTALRKRLIKLKGVNADGLLAPVYAGMAFNDGAQDLIAGLKRRGVRCVLVSGGFTYFTERVAALLDMKWHHGNVLGIDGDGGLTGGVVNDADIVNGAKKAAHLAYYATKCGADMRECMAMGDGSNDLPMMHAAELGIGYKPAVGGKVEAEMRNIIVHGDLSVALYCLT
jgi:phosphoserine phosphatase